MKNTIKSFAQNRISNIVFVFLFIGLFSTLTLNRVGVDLNFNILSEYKSHFTTGFFNTVVISIGSLVCSLLIGAVVAMGTHKHIPFITDLLNFYIQIIRGTPLLVQIYFFYYLVGTAWGLDNRYIAGILILSIFEGAYISEIIRGGLSSIDKQQYEIAQVIGLSKKQTFSLVIFPQLVIRIIPSLAGQFASIIKDSSLLSIIAVIELTHVTQEINSHNYALFENYFFLGALYFSLTLPVMLFSKYLEKKYRYAY